MQFHARVDVKRVLAQDLEALREGALGDLVSASD